MIVILLIDYNQSGLVESISYLYNAAGHQVIRKLPAQGVTIHSVHDSAGRRIAEYNEATGTLIREYVWLGWDPVAVIEGGVVYYIRADHIGRPALATNASGAVVWSLSYTPFGEVHSQTGPALEARFPGQWYQAETGLHQNWMRDYDPTTGRYLQADPLGLIDGASVYGYVRGNPGKWIDPRGEFGVPGAVAGAIAGGVAGYITSGCWQGALVGAGAGAAVGFTGGLLGTTAYGAGVLSFAGAGVGQIAANTFASCDCGAEPIPTIELVTSSKFWLTNTFAGIGGGFGGSLGGGVAPSVTRYFLGAPPYQGWRFFGWRVGEQFVSEGISGLGAGIGEGGVNLYFNYTD